VIVDANDFTSVNDEVIVEEDFDWNEINEDETLSDLDWTNTSDWTTFYELTDYDIDCIVMQWNEELFEDALKNNFKVLLICTREEFMIAQDILDWME